jgi:hypothetical protein
VFYGKSGYRIGNQSYSEQKRKTMRENPYESVTEPSHIPDVLKVPPGNFLLLRAYGKGVQIYTCPDTTNAKPHAILLESDRDEGDLVAIHFAGPTGPNWQALDGSKVVGKKVAQVPSLDPKGDSVDWLKLEAIANEGNGLFSKVTFIQRLYTDGGKAPSGSCDQKQDATEILVEYSAQYLFYGPSTELQ